MGSLYIVQDGVKRDFSLLSFYSDRQQITRMHVCVHTHMYIYIYEFILAVVFGKDLM